MIGVGDDSWSQPLLISLVRRSPRTVGNPCKGLHVDSGSIAGAQCDAQHCADR